jgi:hypothetical protein
MSDAGALKAVEVLVLLAAGVGFVWWQLRDVSQAQKRSRAERERKQAEPERHGFQRESEPPP